MSYQDTEKVAALVRLTLNGYDYVRTEQETGICQKTLRRWEKQASDSTAPKRSFAELLLWSAQRLAVSIPLQNIDLHDWAVAMGILTDKILLFQGLATSRSETITTKLGGVSQDDLDDVISEAEAILEAAASRGAASGDE